MYTRDKQLKSHRCCLHATRKSHHHPSAYRCLRGSADHALTAHLCCTEQIDIMLHICWSFWGYLKHWLSLPICWRLQHTHSLLQLVRVVKLECNMQPRISHGLIAGPPVCYCRRGIAISTLVFAMSTPTFAMSTHVFATATRSLYIHKS
jgi:hypothetical protein